MKKENTEEITREEFVETTISDFDEKAWEALGEDDGGGEFLLWQENGLGTFRSGL